MAGERTVAGTRGCVCEGRIGFGDGSITDNGRLAEEGDLRPEATGEGHKGAEGEVGRVGCHACC